MEFLSFIFGAIVGSFLNVVVFRLGTGRSFLKGRSKCFSCNKTLSWTELIPILSFLFQGGKCKTCGSRISFQYPLVEIVSGLTFFFLWTSFPFSPFLFLLFPIFALFVAILVYDLRHGIIPDEFSYTLAGLTFLYAILFYGGSFITFFSGPLVALPFALIFFVSKGKWMGFGDAKLALSIGWLLGISSGFTALILSSWIGAIGGIIVLLMKKKRLTMKGEEIPFAPFLVLGTAISFFFDLSFESLVLFFL